MNLEQKVMRRIPDCLKNELREKNLWKKFIERREELQKIEGLKSLKARDIALKEIAGIDIADYIANVINPAVQPQGFYFVSGTGTDILPREKSPSKVAPVQIKKKDIPNNKPVSFMKKVEWIYENMGVEDVSIQDAPSPGAFFHLLALKRSKDLQAKFYEGTCSKLLPTRQQIETDDLFEDDGGSVNRVIEQLTRGGFRSVFDRDKSPKADNG